MHRMPSVICNSSLSMIAMITRTNETHVLYSLSLKIKSAHYCLFRVLHCMYHDELALIISVHGLFGVLFVLGTT
jgi:hypothetical protein